MQTLHAPNRQSRDQKRISLRVASAIVTGLLLTGLTGCENTTPLSASRSADSTGVSEASFAQFSDVPIPAGATMDLERSLVLGERDTWIGRLVMTVGNSSGKAYDFFFAEMPRFNWVPVTTVRAETSVLSYTRGERVATIQIKKRTLGGSNISLIVSPKGSAVRAGGVSRSGGGAPASVNISPIR
jgi:hypothetical protein